MDGLLDSSELKPHRRIVICLLRVIGPEMPSAELLAAAAKLTEAEAEFRKALDEKIRVKEEQEEFKAELKAMREAAQWRRLQGISMEGDDVLLAEMDVKVGPKRDEWMTTLPSERKPGVITRTTKFSRTSKDGRGDTSM